MERKPKIVSIVGLTASGKSSVGISFAQFFDGEIISCDSRQVYKHLDIGTAKVTKKEQELVKHHMLDVVEPKEEQRYNVFEFQKSVYKIIDDILKRDKTPILVGGTGLYSRSIVEGYVFTEKSEDNIKKGYKELEPIYEVLQICLLPSKDFISKPIRQRIVERFEKGLIEETEDLLEKGYKKEFLQSLGLEYFWNIEYIEGRVNKKEFIENLYTKTMQFAKRQRTWFKKEKNTVFLTNPDMFLIESEKLIKEFLTNKKFPFNS